VKPGYKQTDVGLLPVDWDAGNIDQAVERLDAGASVNSERDEAPDFASYPRILKTSSAKQGSLDPLESKRVARRDLWRLKVALRKDTILVSRMNTIELVGENGYVDADYPNLFVPDRMWMATLRATVHPRWFSYLLSWQPVKSRISASATGTSGSMKNISKPSLRAVRVPYPPVEEQRAIATALCDVDALLGGLDRLIAKKRDLREAVMQQLLTGRARLPGFHDEWEVDPLGDVATFYKGNGLSKSALSPYGSEACVHYGELFTQYGETIRQTISRTNKSPGAFRSVANDVLMPTSDVTPRGLAKASCVVADRVVLGGDILVIRTDPALVSGTFLSHVIRREEDQVLRLVTGTTVFHLYGKDMKKFIFRHPRLAEQQAIVAALSDMDAELATLGTRRDKTRNLKQAMMQELLAGKTRLVPIGSADA
jgi:type I restriction enzyme S subunit